MAGLSEERIESIAETVESDPESVEEADVAALLEGVGHGDHKIHSPAGDALEELVEAWSDDRIVEQFDVDTLDGRLQTDSVNGGYGLAGIVSVWAEHAPDRVRSLRRQIGLAPAGYFKESTAKEVLCIVLSPEEIATEAEALLTAHDSTPRNVGVRLAIELGGDGYDLDEPHPDAVEPVLPAVWQLASNGRENSKPRENAVKAMQSHAEQRPDAHVDRVGEIAELLGATKSGIRDELIEYLTVIARHDPDAVVPTVPLVREEFTDITGASYSRNAAAELIAELVEDYPVAAYPLDPFVQRLEDDDNTYDSDDASIVATAGTIEHLDALLAANEYDTTRGAELADTIDDDELVFEALRDRATDDDPTTRFRAISTLVEEFHDRVDVPASLYLDRLDDDATANTHYTRTVAEKAMDGLAKIASSDPERLVDTVPELCAAQRESFSEEGTANVSLSRALARVARADSETYARLAGDLHADDELTRCAAVAALSGVTELYPDQLDDPVPALLDIYRANTDGDISIGGSVLSALGGLAYARPAAVEPAVDFLLERYKDTDDVGVYRDVTADIAGVYPSGLTDLTEELADNYADGYSGDWKIDNDEAAIALAHIARVAPDRVREAVGPLAARDDEDRPPSFPLVHIGLGDHDAVPSAWTDDDGVLAERLAEDSERETLRLCRLLAESEYTPAAALLEAARDDESNSDVVREAATEAIERLG